MRLPSRPAINRLGQRRASVRSRQTRTIAFAGQIAATRPDWRVRVMLSHARPKTVTPSAAAWASFTAVRLNDSGAFGGAPPAPAGPGLEAPRGPPG